MMTQEKNTLKAKNRMTLLGLLALIVILFVVTIIKIKTQV